MVRWRTVLGWSPVTLFAVLAGAGAGLCATDQGSPDVLVIGTLDGGQVGLLLLLCAAGCGVVALIQSAVLSGRLRRPLPRVLVRLTTALLLLTALPTGYLLMLAAELSTVTEYRPLAVSGHDVVVRTITWHHRSLDILERDGMLFHPIALCGDSLPVDAYDAFSAGQYDLASRGSRQVIRFAERPGGPYGGEAVLGSRPGDDVSVSCGAG